MSDRPAIIIPVHNRRETTLSCLERLQRQGVMAWASIWVIDDGSGDGTTTAVQACYPAVNTLIGSGEWWWTGAIRAGMAAAIDAGAGWLIWLNDDCVPDDGAIEAVWTTARRTGGFAGGWFTHPTSRRVVYGGFTYTHRGLRLMPPPAQPYADADALNGNLVAFPATLVEAIGWPDERHFPQAHADTDYTLRASQAGVPVQVVNAAHGVASPGYQTHHQSFLCSAITVAEIWRMLGQRGSYAYLPAHWRWETRHWGARGAARVIGGLLWRVPISLVRLIVPQRWLRTWIGHRSWAWRRELAENPPS